jgi:hypothetical protein
MHVSELSRNNIPDSYPHETPFPALERVFASLRITL